jgi:hypothetical protein
LNINQEKEIIANVEDKKMEVEVRTPTEQEPSSEQD